MGKQFVPQTVKRLDDSTANGSRPTVLNLLGLDKIIGVRLGIANAVLISNLRAKLARLELTPKQVSILWLISANPSVSQVELARFFNINRASIYQMVGYLKSKQLIEFDDLRGDRRTRGLALTNQGIAALATARDIVQEHEREFRRSCSVQDFNALNKGVEHILKTWLPVKHELVAQRSNISTRSEV